MNRLYNLSKKLIGRVIKHMESILITFAGILIAGGLSVLIVNTDHTIKLVAGWLAVLGVLVSVIAVFISMKKEHDEDDFKNKQLDIMADTLKEIKALREDYKNGGNNHDNPKSN